MGGGECYNMCREREKEKDFGVVFYESLNPSHHIGNIVKTTKQEVGRY